MPESSSTRSSPGGRARLRLALAAAGALLLLAALVLSLRWLGARDRRAELDSLRAAGEPVWLEDLEAERGGGGPDPAPFLKELARASDTMRWSAEELVEPEGYAAVREAALRGAHGAEARAAFEALDACAGEDAAAAVANLIALVEARDGVAQPPPCGLETAHLALVAEAGRLALARTAGEQGSLDPRSFAPRLDADEPEEQAPSAAVLVSASHALRLAALEAAWRGAPGEVLEHLRAQRELARIASSAPMAIGGLVWTSLVGSLLDALELTLPRLPREAPLDELETWLAGLSPRAEMQRALRGERAFGNGAFEMLRREGGAGLFVALVLDHDHATYLREVGARIDALALRAHERPTRAPLGGLRRRLAPVTRLLLVGEQVERTADRLEARIALARLALRAHASGADAAVELAADRSDPYDGRPLRTALRPDGTLALWSVGEDGDDDGGDAQRDLAWRFAVR